MSERTEAAEYLSRVPMFARIDDEILEALAESSVSREFASGDKWPSRGGQ